MIEERVIPLSEKYVKVYCNNCNDSNNNEYVLRKDIEEAREGLKKDVEHYTAMNFYINKWFGK